MSDPIFGVSGVTFASIFNVFGHTAARAKPAVQRDDGFHTFGKRPDRDRIIDGVKREDFREFGAEPKKKPDEILKKIKAEFEAKKQYKVAGKVDTLLQFVDRAVSKNGDDDFTSSLLKKSRVNIARQSAVVDADGALSDNEKKVAKAELRISFVELAVRKLTPLKLTQTDNVKGYVLGLSELSGELKSLTSDFISGHSGSVTEPDDLAFLEKIDGLHDKLESLIKAQKLPLRREGVFYSVSAENGFDDLDELGVALDLYI